MSFVQPIVLSDHGIRLEPLTLSHEAGLSEAAADGELWNLRITSVPAPDETRAYIQTALEMREAAERFAFAVLSKFLPALHARNSRPLIAAGCIDQGNVPPLARCPR